MPLLPLRLVRQSLQISHCTVTESNLYTHTARKSLVGFVATRTLSSRHYYPFQHPPQLRHRFTQPSRVVSTCWNDSGSHPTSRPVRSMSSDADYAAFLDKANQASGSAEAQEAVKKSHGTKSVNSMVPRGLDQIEEYYTSDADEPFEPVALKFDGSSVSADELKKLIGGDQDVQEVGQKEFGSQYKTVMDAVSKAGNGEIRIFRVELGETRAEYYVVSVDTEQGRVVGLKALSVES
ncbi:hypothetical protein IAQ61_008880 [Plenodomus lingam]|nr:hypothetical protein IAQ61_008880 [Plenodomus lingam]